MRSFPKLKPVSFCSPLGCCSVFSLHYRIITQLLYKVWEMPRSIKKERRRRWHPTQYSCLENPRDGGAWWAAVYGVAQSQTQLKRLSSSSIKKERGVIYDSICQPWPLAITRYICFYSILDLHATSPLNIIFQSFIFQNTHLYIWTYTSKGDSSIIWPLNYFPGEDYSN